MTSAKAADLVPDLSASGYQQADAFGAPALPGQDNWRVVWQKATDAGQIALVDVTVFEDPAFARTAFTSVSAAWENPPPQVVGGASEFVETPSPEVGQERKSYTTPSPDDRGNKIWTDVYRVGNVVVVVQVIDAAANEQIELRERLASEVAAKVG